MCFPVERVEDMSVSVPQVVDIMRVNVDKVLERDQKLSELDDRADALQAGASQFESSAAKLKNKYWWKNCKVGVAVCFPSCISLTQTAGLQTDVPTQSDGSRYSSGILTHNRLWSFNSKCPMSSS